LPDRSVDPPSESRGRECASLTQLRTTAADVIARAGECPEVVLEATYGWYWAVDALQAAGATVHLAHPLGVKAFEYRRVKNDLLTELCGIAAGQSLGCGTGAGMILRPRGRDSAYQGFLARSQREGHRTFHR